MSLNQCQRIRLLRKKKALLAAGVKHADLAAVAAETVAGIAGETAVSGGNAATAIINIIQFAGSRIPSKQTKNGEINTDLS